MDSENILVVSPNWLGDIIMAMPAAQLLRARNPKARICVLCKKNVAGLWRMQPCIDDIVELSPGTRATFAMARALKREHFSTAYILPNSFRSALIPFLARIPKRRGTVRHARGLMINDAVRLPKNNTFHQAREYAQLLVNDIDAPLPDIALDLNSAFRIPHSALTVGIIPGAARGESKRWPYFAEAAQLILQKFSDCRFVVMGAPNEAELCAAVAEAALPPESLGENAANLAGKTTLAEFAAALKQCDVVMCNDSGGMHLATAVNTPVVAVYGLTDPTKTGPLGSRNIVVKPDGVSGNRDISRAGADAIAALRSISPETVADAVVKILTEGTKQ